MGFNSGFKGLIPNNKDFLASFSFWIQIETTINYGLEISFQNTNDVGIFATLTEHMKSWIPQIFVSLTVPHLMSFVPTRNILREVRKCVNAWLKISSSCWTLLTRSTRSKIFLKFRKSALGETEELVRGFKEGTVTILNLTVGLRMNGNKHLGVPSTFIETKSEQHQLDKSS